MNPTELITYASKLEIHFSFSYEPSFKIFRAGAKWMHSYQQVLSGQESKLCDHHYEILGCLKYGLCILLSGVLVFPLTALSAWFAILFVPLFYFFEIHALFLFPIAIESNGSLIKRMILATYELGVYRAFRYTIYIAAYMIVGLFYTKEPFKRWKVGVLAVLVLYHRSIKKETLPIF